ILFAPLTGVLADFESSEGQDYLLVTGFLMLGYLWCRFDASELQRKMRKSTAFALVFFPLAGYPDYLYRVRGYSVVKALSLTLLGFFGLAALTVVQVLVI